MKSAILVLALAAGCSGAFKTKLGPAFEHATPDNGGILYVYRPQKLTMAVRIVHVVVDGEERLVMVGGYAAMRVPPGRHKVYVYSTPSSQAFVTYGYGPTRWRGETEIDVRAGGEAYVRVATNLASLSVKAMSPEAGASEAADCRLSPGGAAR